MEERFRENYFVLLRIALLITLEIYIILSQSVLTGASVKVLLLLALYIGVIAGKEMVERQYQMLFLGMAGILWLAIIFTVGTIFALLGVYLCYEVLTYLKPHILWYLLPLGLALIPSAIGTSTQLMIAFLTGLMYFQHDYVVESYRKQTKEDTITEQMLKHSMNRREHEMQEEVRRNLLMAENQILEEREELS